MTDSPETAQKILVVDDEVGVVALVQRVLESRGFISVGAYDGLEGWNRFLEGGWDLIILDRAMPGLNGEELAAQIKQRQPDIPIIMATGIPSAIKQHELFAAILEKPFRIPELLETVRKALPGPSR